MKTINYYIGKRCDFTSFEFLKKAFENEFPNRAFKNNIEFGEYGKPFFSGSQMPFFNLSNSGEYVVCVFDNSGIGIDIQKIREIRPEVQKRYFHKVFKPLKRQTLEWTRFESYGKMLGCGVPLKDGEDYKTGFFCSNITVEGYAITVCSSKRAFFKIRKCCLDK